MAAPPDDDPLLDAELQMAKHELAIFTELFSKLLDRLGLARVDNEEIPTEADVRAAFVELADEDPEVLDLAVRLGVLERFREPPPAE